MSINRNLAIWLKGREFDSETNVDGEIVVIPKSNHDLFATIDPDKKQVHYWQEFPEPCICSNIPEDDLDDLKHFVNLLMEKDE